MSITVYFTKKCTSRSCKFELDCSCKVRNLFVSLCTSTKIICACISAISQLIGVDVTAWCPKKNFNYLISCQLKTTVLT